MQTKKPILVLAFAALLSFGACGAAATQERQQLLDSGVREDELDGVMIAKDQVFPQTMTNALDWLKQEYGSVTGCLAKELGVADAQITQLRNRFLR